MPKSDYVNPSDTAFGQQLTTTKNAIGGYAGTVDVTAAQITAEAADADYFNYLVACQSIMQNAAQQWTAWKNLIRNGGPLPPGGAPAAPVLPTTVTAVAPGVEPRYRALVQQGKNGPHYNVPMGEALGWEGAQQTGPDLSTIQPAIDAVVSGSSVLVGWGWGRNSQFLDMCEIEVDRADGKGFVLLAMDTTPGYTDTAPLPAAPAKWTYRAIYRVGDHRVGQWSKPVTITVGG